MTGVIEKNKECYAAIERGDTNSFQTETAEQGQQMMKIPLENTWFNQIQAYLN